MKKVLLIIPIILLLSGCYDYTEIDDVSIITGIILDYKDNKYELTTEVLENEKESKKLIYKTTCDNIDLCLLKISKESNKELFISHLKVLILTNRTINKDIKFYDFFLRNAKSKMNFFIYYIGDEYIDKLFNTIDESASLFLKDMSEFNSKNYSSSIKLSFIDMIQNIVEDKDIVYPNIIIKDNKLFIDSLVSFNKNNQILKLSNNESIFYNILSNNTIITSLSIPCDNATFSLTINNPKTKYKYNNDLNIAISSNGKLSNYKCKYDLNEKNTIKTLEKLANSYIKQESNNLINLSKKENIDFLNFKSYIYKHSKKYIDLNNIKDNIVVNISITSIGESR